MLSHVRCVCAYCIQDKLRGILGIKIKVLVTEVDWPVGTMMGQSLEIAEAVRCLNMVGPSDLHDLVIKLGERRHSQCLMRVVRLQRTLRST